jgi:hypothetical protein
VLVVVVVFVVVVDFCAFTRVVARAPVVSADTSLANLSTTLSASRILSIASTVAIASLYDSETTFRNVSLFSCASFRVRRSTSRISSSVRFLNSASAFDSITLIVVLVVALIVVLITDYPDDDDVYKPFLVALQRRRKSSSSEA